MKWRRQYSPIGLDIGSSQVKIMGIFAYPLEYGAPPTIGTCYITRRLRLGPHHGYHGLA